MRAASLACIALEAEAIRWRCRVRRSAVRFGLAVAGFLFAACAIAVGHAAAWHALCDGAGQSFYAAAGTLGGFDVFAAAVLGFVAARSGPSGAEARAEAVRRDAVGEMAAALGVTPTASAAFAVACGLSARKPG